eukprot:TRINITY_DN41321_c0_g1_i1.p1 TRINITY_DN41321_c0_g1~~TRINITY_DN41321_c0_g1_i1.p1  ORF type:complete len:238 (-),score=43.98 TRINITY_DN41321_c0_g1_i1:192-905(-)
MAAHDSAPHPADYYELLQVSRDADEEMIKKAYRKQALKWHPDKQDADNRSYAEERFKLIAEAYQVLNDPQKRATYDRCGKDGLRGASSGPGDFDSPDGHTVFRGFGGPGVRVVFRRTGPDGTTFTTTSSGANGVDLGGFNHPFFGDAHGPGFSAFDHPFFSRGERRDPFEMFRDVFGSADFLRQVSAEREENDLERALRISEETAACEEEERMRRLQPDMDDDAALQAALQASMAET